MPETITTAAELDALPVGSVVRSDAGTIACRHTSGRAVCFGVAESFPWDLALPCTVLYRPDQPTAEPATAKPSEEAVAEVLYGQFTRNRIAEWDDITDDSDQPRYAWLHAARAVLGLLDSQRPEAEVKAEALREYAAARYQAYLEQPETPWTEQPSDLAKRYAKAAEELRAEANRIEREG